MVSRALILELPRGTKGDYKRLSTFFPTSICIKSKERNRLKNYYDSSLGMNKEAIGRITGSKSGADKRIDKY